MEPVVVVGKSQCLPLLAVAGREHYTWSNDVCTFHREYLALASRSLIIIQTAVSVIADQCVLPIRRRWREPQRSKSKPIPTYLQSYIVSLLLHDVGSVLGFL